MHQDLGFWILAGLALMGLFVALFRPADNPPHRG